jgi:pilus assembly protein Flp/PilA
MLQRLTAKAQVWWHSLREERGATAVEYALMVALIAAVIIVAVVALGQNASQTFQDVADTIAGS